jgi:hypothetical protein
MRLTQVKYEFIFNCFTKRQWTRVGHELLIYVYDNTLQYKQSNIKDKD